jgi:hypothetical protein
MSWFDFLFRPQEHHLSYKELEDTNTEDSLVGFNTRASEKRGRNRLNARRTSLPKVLEEENVAINFSREREPQSYDDGARIADDSVDEPFWRRLR